MNDPITSKQLCLLSDALTPFIRLGQSSKNLLFITLESRDILCLSTESSHWRVQEHILVWPFKPYVYFIVHLRCDMYARSRRLLYYYLFQSHQSASHTYCATISFVRISHRQFFASTLSSINMRALLDEFSRSISYQQWRHCFLDP